MAKKKSVVQGVYMIHCVVENKCYIGSAGNPDRRMSDHRVKLKAGESHHRLLQEAWDRCGGKPAFTFSTIEQCPDIDLESLKARETYWQRFYNSVDEGSGYNLEYADRSRSNKETANKTQKGNKRDTIKNPIICIDDVNCLQEKEVEFVNAGSISRFTGIPVNKILDVCDYWIPGSTKGRRSYGGRVYVRKKDFNPSIDYINAYRERKPRDRSLEKKRHWGTSRRALIRAGLLEKTKFEVPIVLVCINTGAETIYSSVSKAIEDLKLTRSKVYKCLNNEYGKYSHRGYFFRKL